MGESHGGRAEERRRAAEQRQNELEVLRLRLASGEKLTEADVEEAERRAAEAQKRAAEAETSARTAYQEAAAAHRSAATVNECAGRPAEATRHRRAAELDMEAFGQPAH